MKDRWAVIHTWLDQNSTIILVASLIVGLVLRAFWVLVWYPVPVLEGGDGPFYISLAEALVRGDGLTLNGAPILTAGPLYPLLLVPFRAFFDDGTWLLAARLGDVLISTGSVALGYWLTRMLFGRAAAGLAAVWLAIDGRFIVESGQIQTEGLFIFCLLLAVGAYVWALQRENPRWLLLAAVAFGLAVLTRPVAVVLLGVVLLHLLIRFGPRAALPRIIWFVLPFGLAVLPWLARNYQATGMLSVGEGAAAHFWLGTVYGEWEGQAAFQAAVAELPRDPDNPYGNPPATAYLDAAFTYIRNNPLAYLQRLALKLANAYFQPMGTVVLGGVGLKEMTLDWLQGRSSFGAMLAVPQFWPKLWIYIGHFCSIGLAGLGMWRWRDQWREWLLLILVIGAISGAYLFLTIIPRYVYPIMPFFIVLAAAGIIGQRQQR